MIGTGPNQIESPLLTLGLRTVDGTCNNLQPGQEKYGAADETFPRLTTPEFNAAEDCRRGIRPGRPATSYDQTTGSVFDSEPRTVSNLIVDQTVEQPGGRLGCDQSRAVPVRGARACAPEPPLTPLTACPPLGRLDIPNVTTDVGLSPPFNSLFTIFGQFFDHGLDKITNGGNGNVFVPLKADDPLVTHGPDGIAGNGDEVPADQRSWSSPAAPSWRARTASATRRTPTPRSSTRARPTPRTRRTRCSCVSTRSTADGPTVVDRQVPQHRPTARPGHLGDDQGAGGERPRPAAQRLRRATTSR